MSIENLTPQFRQCASAFLVHPKIYDRFLLVQKPRTSDAWQLPQGGIDDGETPLQAAVRELMEEVSAEVSVLHSTNVVYEYMFPRSYTGRFVGAFCGQQIYFHVGICSNPDFLQVDNHEITDFAWITIDQVSQYIERNEYRSVVEHLAAQAPKILSL